jgi:predicted O-linked N-acetylglucosamine transferase (SPINDLY family)
MNDNRQLQTASAAYSAGDWKKAARICAEILEFRANHFEALHLLGIIKAQTRQLPEAAELLARAAAAAPNNATAHNSYGNVLRDLQQHGAAVESYDRALRIQPAYPEAYNNRGGALLDLGRVEDALRSYELAVRYRADFAEARYNCGVLLHQLGRFDEAVLSFQQALKLRPSYVEAHFNLGNSLFELRRFDPALQSYIRALQIKEEFAEAHNNKGNALSELGRSDEALISFQRALQLSPRLAHAYNNSGNTLLAVGRPLEALTAFERALNLDPELDWAFGMRLYCKMLLCDWNGMADSVENLRRHAALGRRLCQPFVALALSDDLVLHGQLASVAGNASAYVSRALEPMTTASRAPRIRVAYYSGDFQNHAVAHAMAEFFELHDRRNFEITAFSLGGDPQDPMRQRLEKSFDRFIDVRMRSDREVAVMSRELGIDIAVDLQGYSQGNRPDIFASRAAPLQVNYLGYPGTLGVPYVDYLIADRVLITPATRPNYAERIVYLPHSYLLSDRSRTLDEEAFTRSQLQLPERGFVFCCFNSVYKIAPAAFDSWMRILRRIEGSVLWLKAEQPLAIANLRREAEQRGVSGSRLIFAKSMPLPQHLARHRAAGLFLDTFPYGAHSTANDALWSGLPILTRAGESFASRVAASLLSAIGMPELIAETELEYETLAVEIASDENRLAQLKSRLEGARRGAPLFDTPRTARAIEEVYRSIHERRHAKLESADLLIKDDLSHVFL